MDDSLKQYIDSEWLIKHGIHQFSQKAMATVFDVFIHHHDGAYASQAATDAFSQLDLLEQDLSRFVENSDISRINHLRPGESTIIGMDTMECLVIAQKIQTKTKGAFNPTIGKIITHWKDEIESEIDSKENVGSLLLDAVSFTVTLMDNPISIDLGGIGKGFALDKLMETLNEWDIETVLFNSGKSTFLAGDTPGDEHGWPLTITHPITQKEIERIYLTNNAMAGSGIEKGNHIISPSNYEPVQDRLAAWSLAKTGAEADALSTSFMIMDETDIQHFVKNNSDIRAIVIDETGEMKKDGDWN